MATCTVLTMAAGRPAPKKDTTYWEALFEKRIEYVRQLRSVLDEPGSVAAQTVAAYTELLDGAALHDFCCHDWVHQILHNRITCICASGWT